MCLGRGAEGSDAVRSFTPPLSVTVVGSTLLPIGKLVVALNVVAAICRVVVNTPMLLYYEFQNDYTHKKNYLGIFFLQLHAH